MINRLFKIMFESNLIAFITFLALNALLTFVVIMETSHKTVGSGFFGSISAWLIVNSLVAGTLSLLRYNKERHSRLYAQLPVSSLEIRIAHWSHASLYLCISSFLLLVMMLFAGNFAWHELVMFTLLYFCHAGVALAVISIVAGNSMTLIPDEIRKRTIAYFFMATCITFLFLGLLGAVIGTYINVIEAKAVNWTLLTTVMLFLCVGLVCLDLQLFSRKQSYVG